MCDTFVIPPELSLTGNRILAKNSDREPNEAQALTRQAAITRPSDTLQLGKVAVQHVRDPFTALLSRPFHLWGAEMGVNAHGVAIGNEAVFTRLPKPAKGLGLTGMDMLRLALERSRTAREALGHLVHSVEAYGQDACGGYRNRSFYYDNSFLIADPEEAWLLETADRFWVYRAIPGFWAISNRLTIGGEYDGIHPGARDHAHRKGWIPAGREFDFSEAFSEPMMTRLAKGAERQATCHRLASSHTGEKPAGPAEAMAMLRAHRLKEGFLPHRAGMDNICLHASGLLTPSQTTASMVAELSRDPLRPVWFTQSAAPCLSLFKPYYVDDHALSMPSNPVPGATHDRSYWWQWEEWHRMAIRNHPAATAILGRNAGTIEMQWLKQTEEMLSSGGDARQASELSARAVRQSLDILREIKQEMSEQPVLRTDLSYRFHWGRWNRRAGIPFR